MKKSIQILLLSVILLAACGKGETPQPAETKQGVNVSFVKDKKLSSGEIVQEPFLAQVVMIWKSDGKDFEYKGFEDGTYAFDKTSQQSFKSDFQYLNTSKERIDLEPGKYFITMSTDDSAMPMLAYTYTSFTVTSGAYVEVKKNVTTMGNYKYSPW